MKTLTLVISASFLMLCAAVSRADDESDLHRAAASINGQAITNDGRTRVLNSISTQTGVPVATLQAERSSTGYGFGELLIANLLASASGKSFDDIGAMRKTEGWGKIAKDLGLNLGKIVSKAHRADQAAQNAQIGQQNGQSGQGNSAFGLSHGPGSNANGMGFGPMNNPGRGMGHGHGP
jgi:hypothetical protein